MSAGEPRTIFEIVGDVVGPEWDDRTAEEITDKVLAELECPEPWRSLFAPLVRKAVVNAQTNRQRESQRRATVGEIRNGGFGHTGAAQQPLSDEVAGESLSLAGLEGQADQWVRMPPDGKRYKWGELTLAQHRERRDWFEVRGRTMLREASLHRAVIERCEGAGVATLFELVALLRKGAVA